MKFGTGALKITPGHDPVDYEINKGQNLPIIEIMNKDGSMNAIAGNDWIDAFISCINCAYQTWPQARKTTWVPS